MIIDPSELVERVKAGGTIREDEVAEVRRRLRRPSAMEDIYDLVRALALGSEATTDNVALVEPYLLQATDDWNAQGAIYALCEYWQLTSRYIGKLLFFTELAQWDEFPSAGIAAFSALGAHVFDKKDPKVAMRLISLFEHDIELLRSAPSEFKPVHLDCTYQALYTGVRGRDARRLATLKRVPEDVDQSILEDARKLAGGEPVRR